MENVPKYHALEIIRHQCFKPLQEFPDDIDKSVGNRVNSGVIAYGRYPALRLGGFALTLRPRLRLFVTIVFFTFKQAKKQKGRACLKVQLLWFVLFVFDGSAV